MIQKILLENKIKYIVSPVFQKWRRKKGLTKKKVQKLTGYIALLNENKNKYTAEWIIEYIGSKKTFVS